MEIKINGEKSDLIAGELDLNKIKNFLDKNLKYGEFVDSSYLTKILKLNFAPSYIRDKITQHYPKNFIKTKRKKILFASEKTISDYKKYK